MALIDDVKDSLRVDGNDLDGEISDLISAAKADLKLSGVLESKITDTDPLIKRAITVYVKANFGWDNSDADRFTKSYEMLKMHLTLTAEYTEAIT